VSLLFPPTLMILKDKLLLTLLKLLDSMFKDSLTNLPLLLLLLDLTKRMLRNVMSLFSILVVVLLTALSLTSKMVSSKFWLLMEILTSEELILTLDLLICVLVNSRERVKSISAKTKELLENSALKLRRLRKLSLKFKLLTLNVKLLLKVKISLTTYLVSSSKNFASIYSRKLPTLSRLVLRKLDLLLKTLMRSSSSVDLAEFPESRASLLIASMERL
jgi:hypothetical protein